MEMDYLVPGEMIASLEILQRYTEPLLRRLADEAKWLDGVLATATDPEGRLSSCMTVAVVVAKS